MTHGTPRAVSALAAWAVHCDALARGEQIFLLRPGAGEDDPPVGTRAWLVPRWTPQRPRDLTDPYRDRLEKLDALRHRDGRVRLQYVVSLEYRDVIDHPAPLLRLDGEHTLNAGAVEERFEAAGSLALLLLRVRRSPGALVLGSDEVGPRASEGTVPRWVTVDREPVSNARPVLSDAEFLERKARVLQRTGSVRAL